MASSDGKSSGSVQRPLSPHLQVYRPQITSTLSILHRMTGVALSVGTIVLIYWLFAIASGAEAFAQMQACFSSWIGRLLLFGWSFALFYHLCNGIRHLFWDAGKGYELDTAARSGIAVIVVSIALTIGVWFCAYTGVGAF